MTKKAKIIIVVAVAFVLTAVASLLMGFGIHAYYNNPLSVSDVYNDEVTTKTPKSITLYQYLYNPREITSDETIDQIMGMLREVKYERFDDYENYTNHGMRLVLCYEDETQAEVYLGTVIRRGNGYRPNGEKASALHTFLWDINRGTP